MKWPFDALRKCAFFTGMIFIILQAPLIGWYFVHPTRPFWYFVLDAGLLCWVCHCEHEKILAGEWPYRRKV